jgi:hypothetical protein
LSSSLLPSFPSTTPETRHVASFRGNSRDWQVGHCD